MVAFFVKCDYSVPAYMDPVYNYIHFASIWYDFPDYEDNYLFIPTYKKSMCFLKNGRPEALPKGLPTYIII